MIEELVPKCRAEFSNFDIFADRLDDLIMPYLSGKKFDVLSKVYVWVSFVWATDSQLLNLVLAHAKNI